VDALWWEENDLRRDPRFENVERVQGYDDYLAEFTVEEAKQLAAKYAPSASEWHEEKVKDLDQKLASGDLKLVRVLVYEWQSGYD
jgi:hypothetical protein